MKNFVKNGDNVSITFPVAVASGGAVLVGAALFGVAQADTAQNALGALLTTGVYQLPKAAGAIVPGDKLYWDNAAKVLTQTAAGNVYVAVATRAAADAEVSVYARLNGVVI